MAEHHNMVGIASSSTAVTMGYLAGGTSRIRIGSGGIMLPNHAPLVVAEAIGTLEALYPGRIDLGLGRAPGTAGKMRFGIDALMSKVSFSGGRNDVEPAQDEDDLTTPLNLPELAELMAQAAFGEVHEDAAQQALTPWAELETLMCEHIADGRILEFWFAALAWLLNQARTSETRLLGSRLGPHIRPRSSGTWHSDWMLQNFAPWSKP